MISKKNYIVLRKIPQFPETTTLVELQKSKAIKWRRINVSLLAWIVEESMDNGLIAHKGRSAPYEVTSWKFYRTEAGQIALEEYKRSCSASVKSTWALIIAGLSFLVSCIR